MGVVIGSRPGHGCIPGCFRSELSDLYAQNSISLHVRKDEWKLEAQYVKKLVRHGNPYGTAVFRNCNRQRYSPERGEFPWFGGSSLHDGGKQNRRLLPVPLMRWGYYGDLCGAEYRGREAGAYPQGIKTANIIGAAYAAVALTVMFLPGKPLRCCFVDRTETEILSNEGCFCYATHCSISRWPL